MKRIFKIILFLLLFIPSNTYANYIYGDYQEYKMNTDELLEESDVLKREEILLYNTYEKVKNDLGYQEVCENYDDTDFKEETIFSKEKIDGSVGYQPVLINSNRITSLQIYDYKERKKIYELNIYYDGNKIDYDLLTDYQEKFELFRDNNLETYTELYGNDYININFHESYDPSKILIEIIGDEMFSHLIVFYNNAESFQGKFTGNYIYFVDKEEYNRLSKEYGNYNLQYTVYSHTNVLNHYRKQIKKYHCFQEEIVPKNEYVQTGDNILLNDYIKRYNYYIRTKQEISDIDEEENKQETKMETSTTNVETLSQEVEKTTKKVEAIKKDNKEKTTKPVEEKTIIEENKKNDEEIIKVEPLKNEIIEEKININYISIIKYILIILIILQLLAYCLHRKK